MDRMVTTLTALGIGLGLVGCTDMPAAQSPTVVSPSSNMMAGPGAGAINPANNPNVPGATGNTIVPGDSSTISGDAAATLMQRTAPMTPSS
jgi:hypothetical protein